MRFACLIKKPTDTLVVYHTYDFPIATMVMQKNLCGRLTPTLPVLLLLILLIQTTSIRLKLPDTNLWGVRYVVHNSTFEVLTHRHRKFHTSEIWLSSSIGFNTSTERSSSISRPSTFLQNIDTFMPSYVASHTGRRKERIKEWINELMKLRKKKE